MNESCDQCATSFVREDGFYIGSIYINYGVTSLIVAISFPLLLFNGVATNNQLLWGAAAFVFTFPVWFFRYARSLWLAFDQLCDPQGRETS